MRLFAVAFCALLATPVAALAQDLPPGPGADALQQGCGGCHGLDTVTAERHDLEGWKGVINDMINNGASLSNAQVDQVANYLNTNFGLAPPAGDPSATPAAPGTAAPVGAGVAPAPDASAPAPTQAPPATPPAQ